MKDLNELELKELRSELIKSYIERYKTLQTELSKIEAILTDLCFDREIVKSGGTTYEIRNGKPIHKKSN